MATRVCPLRRVSRTPSHATSEALIPKSNFQSSDGYEAIFRGKTTEQPLKMSGKVREGNRRGFLAIVNG
jgi:hypothetical protein